MNEGKEKLEHLLPLRQRQALETRRLILEAASILFSKDGYTATTIEAIATQAGVAVSTVYAAFGSKRAILRGIRTAWHEKSRIREAVFSTPSDLDPASRLRHFAQATRRQWETGSSVLAIYRGAAAADREAAAELAEALRGRRTSLDSFSRSLGPALRTDLPLERASAVLRALCLPEVHEELVVGSGWSEDEYEVWLAAALERELLP